METNNTQFFQTGTRKTKTRILSTNVNGIENKIEYVLELIKREKIDITLIQETHHYNTMKIKKRLKEEKLTILENKEEKKRMANVIFEALV